MGIWRYAICNFPAREVVDGVIVPVVADIIVEVIDTRRFFHSYLEDAVAGVVEEVGAVGGVDFPVTWGRRLRVC